MTKIVFVKNKREYEVDAKDGLSLLDVANEVENHFLAGNCGGALSCGSCHVFIEDNFLSLLEEITEEEDDLLEISPLTQSNSRLGCQVFVSSKLEGMRVHIP